MQVIAIALLVELAVLNPATADNQKTQNLINKERSQEVGKISIKKIRNLGGKEFSYQN